MTQKESKRTQEERVTQLKEKIEALTNQLSLIEVEITTPEFEGCSKEHVNLLRGQFSQLTEEISQLHQIVCRFRRKFKRKLSDQENHDLVSIKNNLMKKQTSLWEFFTKKDLLHLQEEMKNLKTYLNPLQFSICRTNLIWHASLDQVENSNSRMRKFLTKLDVLADYCKIAAEASAKYDKETLSPALTELLDSITKDCEESQKKIDRLYCITNEKALSAYKIYAKKSGSEDSEPNEREVLDDSPRVGMKY